MKGIVSFCPGRFCFDDAPKIEFDGTDNIPSNADDLLGIVQGRLTTGDQQRFGFV